MDIQKIFKLIVLALLLSSCKNENIVEIKLNLKKESKAVFISVPIDGNYFSGAFKEYEVQNGAFDIKLDNIDKTSLIKISDGQRSRYIAVSSGGEYRVDFTEDVVEFYGKNAEGNLLLNSLGILSNPKFNLKDIDECGNAESKLEYIAKEEDKYKKMFDELFEQKLIDKEFKDIAYGQTMSYFETLFSTSMFFQFRLIERDEEQINFFLNNELPLWGSVYKNISDKKYILQSNLLYDYSFRYIEYLDLLNSQRLIFERNHFNNIRPTLNLSGSFLEYTWAETIYNESLNNLFEKPWIESYNDFTDKFPDSKLKEWLKPSIDKIITYHENAEKQDEEVVFYDKEINSVEELGEVLKGKVSYVDIWSTGCTPCREELQYSLKIHDKLKELGVQSVYISLDYDENIWSKMVKSLPLKGLNVLANKSLNKDLFNKLTNFNGIPRYVVFGVDGKIINDAAPRPSSGDKLLKYLEETVQK